MRPCVVNVIPSREGGGAENIVDVLTRSLPFHGIETHRVFRVVPSTGRLGLTDHLIKWRSFLHPLALVQLIFLLRKFAITHNRLVIHAHLTESLYAISLISFFVPAKLIFTEHSTNSFRKRYKILKYIEKFIFSRFDRLVFVSKAAQDAALDWVPSYLIKSRSQVIYNGIDVDYWHFSRRLRKNEITAISVASLHAYKGFEVVFGLLSKNPELIQRYLVVGDGPHRDTLETIVQKSSLESVVCFLGWRKDVRQFLRQSSFAIISSKHESFSLFALEAIASGLPLVVTNIPALNELLGGLSSVFFFDSEDVDSLELAIRKCINYLNSDSRDTQIALRRAREFTSSKMVSNHVKLYIAT